MLSGLPQVFITNRVSESIKKNISNSLRRNTSGDGDFFQEFRISDFVNMLSVRTCNVLLRSEDKSDGKYAKKINFNWEDVEKAKELEMGYNGDLKSYQIRFEPLFFSTFLHFYRKKYVLCL